MVLTYNPKGDLARVVQNKAGQKAVVAYFPQAKKRKCRRATRWAEGKPGKNLKNPSRKIANSRLKSGSGLDEQSQQKMKNLCSRGNKKK